MRRVVIGVVVAGSLASCAPYQRPGGPERPRSSVEVAKLFDAASVYGHMGLFVTGAPLPTVGSVHYLAGRSPDSTLALFALSLANHALTFRRQGNEFIAEYHVEVTFRADSGVPVQLVSDQAVRVRGFQETVRSDESVLFQGQLTLRPGPYSATVVIRDRNSPAIARDERTDTVPRFGSGDLTSPIPIYQGKPRASVADRPDLLINPRATLPYGADTLRFYLEGYGLAPGTRLAAEAVDQNDNVLWRDTVTLRDSGGLAQGMILLASTMVPVGEEQLRLTPLGGRAPVEQSFLVTFSSQWAITNFAEMVSLLRYFERQDLVARLRSAPPELRAKAWRDFWTGTDPAPLTAENEALDEYLHRVQAANFRFQEGGEPGWLTDRGMVFITLGQPDEVQDLTSTALARGATQYIRWVYNSLRVMLVFQDQAGFGRFELTPNSRADYQQALARIRHL